MSAEPLSDEEVLLWEKQEGAVMKALPDKVVAFVYTRLWQRFEALVIDRDALRAQAKRDADRLAELETKYRRELWVSHGHPHSALYGDDGEMQCGACAFDFKRASLWDCEQQRIIVRSALLAPTSAERTRRGRNDPPHA